MTTAAPQAAGRRYPNPQHLIDFLERHTLTLDYLKRTADMIQQDYPGSADELLPRIRAIYKAKRGKIPFI